MEKTIIIIFCFVFGVSCSELEEKKPEEKSNEKVEKKENKKAEGFCAELSQTQKEFNLELTEVHWMYMDDSLKNICRPLNFQMPWMSSDIKTIPEMITPEILNLSPIKTFEIISKSNEILNDSLYYFHYELKRDFCHCDVFRFYKGNMKNKSFSGFEITEQIVCNAKNELTEATVSKLKVSDKEEENDSTKYEIHGHEH